MKLCGCVVGARGAGLWLACAALALGSAPAMAGKPLVLHQVVGGQGSYVGGSKVLNYLVESSIVLSDPDYFDPLAVEYDFVSSTQTVKFFDGSVQIDSQTFQARNAGQLIAGYLPGILPVSLEQYFTDTNQTIFDFGQVVFPQLFSETSFGFSGTKIANLIVTGAGTALSPGSFSITDPRHPGMGFSGETSRDLGTVTAVAEPASWAMMIAGLGLAGGWMRRARSPRKGEAFSSS